MKVKCIKDTEGLGLGFGKVSICKDEQFDVVQKIKDTESGESMYILTNSTVRFVADAEDFEVIDEKNF